MNELDIIGRTEQANFPELLLDKVFVKIDTGAYTSSLHCAFVKKIDEKHVEFEPLDSSHHSTGKSFVLPIVKKTTVKSSNGETEERFIIQTKIEIKGKEFDIRFSLTDRTDMKFPILIGRRFLANKFLVDVTKKKH